MHLSELLVDIVSLPASLNVDVRGLCCDSRKAQSGDLFLAYPGEASDGRLFIGEAIKRGVVAVLCEPPVPAELSQQGVHIIEIPELKNIIGKIAARYYQHPADAIMMIGITGTNGKTSCSHFIARCLQAAGQKCGIIGTLGLGFPGQLTEFGLTTPDAITLQQALATMRDNGAKAVAMEVSSHSLVQHRVDSIAFDIAVFTNLTRDHLDYHGTMEAYAAAKQRLFFLPGLQYAVLNLDDVTGRAWLPTLPKNLIVYGYTQQPSAATIPTVRAVNVELLPQGIQARVITPWGEGILSSQLFGRFNLSNLLAVLTVLGIMDIPLSRSLNYLAALSTVPGRMQTLGGKGKPLVVVDYAHTPDALAQVLNTLREHVSAKLWCVFGCGGDRDRGKRPLMAQAAERYSDQIIVTSDNPRREAPESIIADIMTGFEKPSAVQTIVDRRRAIATAIEQAGPNDIILIAGKGHENYQIIGAEKSHFSDAEEVKHCLQRR